MKLIILAVDKDKKTFIEEQIVWNAQGFELVRVESMIDAINFQNNKNLLFIAINANNIDFLGLLTTMREVLPNIPILIITSNFNVFDQVEALQHSADFYCAFNKSAEENVLSARAMLQRRSEAIKPKEKTTKIICYDGLLISPNFYQLFYEDKELDFTRKECLILKYLITNHDCTLSHESIISNVWGNGYEDDSPDKLWNHIHRVKSKLIKATGKAYIESVRGIGYKFTSKCDEKLVTDEKT